MTGMQNVSQRDEAKRKEVKRSGKCLGVQSSALSESNLITNWPFGTHPIFTQLIKSYHVGKRTTN